MQPSLSQSPPGLPVFSSPPIPIQICAPTEAPERNPWHRIILPQCCPTKFQSSSVLCCAYESLHALFQSLPPISTFHGLPEALFSLKPWAFFFAPPPYQSPILRDFASSVPTASEVILHPLHMNKPILYPAIWYMSFNVSASVSLLQRELS